MAWSCCGIRARSAAAIIIITASTASAACERNFECSVITAPPTLAPTASPQVSVGGHEPSQGAAAGAAALSSLPAHPARAARLRVSSCSRFSARAHGPDPPAHKQRLRRRCSQQRANVCTATRRVSRATNPRTQASAARRASPPQGASAPRAATPCESRLRHHGRAALTRGVEWRR